MRVLIFSDSHGSVDEMLNVCRRTVFDLVIHLGDCERDAAILASSVDKPVLSVAGNCDFFPKNPYTVIEKISGVNVYICHGNSFGGDANEAAALAKQNGCTVILYGHTHVPLCEYTNGVLTINPGSISRPRYPARCRSYAVGSFENGNAMINIEEYV